MIGWVLPSPAWATTGISTSCSSAIAATAASRSGSSGTGAPTSSSSSAPRASTAGNATRRACDEHLALVGVVGDERPRSRRPPRRPPRISAISRSRAAPGASDCATSSAPASRSRPHRPEVLDRVDRRRVHQLHHRGPQRAADRDHGLARRPPPTANDATSVARGRLRRHQPQDRPGDDPERALAADEQLEQATARRRP